MRQEKVAVILDARLALDERHREVAELTEDIGHHADKNQHEVVRRIAEPCLADNAEQHQRKRAADGPADRARPGLVRADVRRHLALAEPHAKIHRQRIAHKRDAERREHIDLAKLPVHTQQENAAVHRWEHDAADDGHRHIVERERFFLSIRDNREEEGHHHKDPAEDRNGRNRKIVCAAHLFLKEPYLLHDDRCDKSPVEIRWDVLPCRVQQLIGRDARDAANDEHRRPCGAGKQHGEQRRQADDNHQPSLFHFCFSCFSPPKRRSRC